MKNEVKLKKDRNLEDIFLNDKKIKFPECIDIKLIYQNIRNELIKYHDNASSNPSICSLKDILSDIKDIVNRDHSKNNLSKIKEIVNDENDNDRLSKIKSILDNDDYENNNQLSKIKNILNNDDYFIFLNKHGSTHVKHVIENASKIISNFKYGLNSLEIFVLLSAIQLHDSALVYGRFNHEININTIMNKKIDKYIPDISLSKIIYNVASTHSGKIKYKNKSSKDVIGHKSSKLKDESKDFLNFPIREKLLAAILRFSDEISDDYRRVDEQALEDNMLGVSKIYHIYSKSVRNVSIGKDNNDNYILEIDYRIDKDLINKKFKKPNEKDEIFLIDEIYNRTKKMELERRYCMRFIRNYFYICGIKVIIKIVNYTNNDLIDKNNFESGAYTYNDSDNEYIIEYYLSEFGYPEDDFKEDEQIINGKNILEELNKKGWNIKNE